jgi:hypothetical protein
MYDHPLEIRFVGAEKLPSGFTVRGWVESEGGKTLEDVAGIEEELFSSFVIGNSGRQTRRSIG